MKENELRENTICALCKDRIGKSQVPTFLTVNIKQYKLNHQAITRQSGLESMLGSPVLAQAMGPDEDLATKMQDRTITVCFTCAAMKETTVAEMLTAGIEKDLARDGIPKSEFLPQEEYIIERINTSHTGRILITTALVKKYRELTKDYESTNEEIRAEMISKYSDYI